MQKLNIKLTLMFILISQFFFIYSQDTLIKPYSIYFNNQRVAIDDQDLHFKYKHTKKGLELYVHYKTAQLKTILYTNELYSTDSIEIRLSDNAKKGKVNIMECHIVGKLNTTTCLRCSNSFYYSSIYLYKQNIHEALEAEPVVINQNLSDALAFLKKEQNLNDINRHFFIFSFYEEKDTLFLKIMYDVKPFLFRKKKILKGFCQNHNHFFIFVSRLPDNLTNRFVPLSQLDKNITKLERIFPKSLSDTEIYYFYIDKSDEIIFLYKRFD